MNIPNIAMEAMNYSHNFIVICVNAMPGTVDDDKDKRICLRPTTTHHYKPK